MQAMKIVSSQRLGAPAVPEFAQSELLARVAMARTAGVQAGEILQEYSARGVQEFQKGLVDFVTDADQASEDFITAEISRAFPKDTIFAEESGGELSADGFGWVVDPLDGTTNFMHGVPHYAVSIGIAYAGVPVGGVVVDPSRREIFSGLRGEGAFLGDRAISVSRRKELQSALLATGFPYDRRQRAQEILSRIQRALLIAHGIRRCGAAALDLCWLACGRYDGFFEQSLNPWDTCAGVAIIWEAGGLVSDYDGSEFALTEPSLVASNGHFHQALLEQVVRSRMR
jgi:myo-inositol-1(or 4)-monophosphatase